VQAALLLSINVLALVLLILTFIKTDKPGGALWSGDFWLALKVGMLLLVIGFFFLLKRLTIEFNRHYDQIRADSKLLYFATVYPYLVFGLFITSVAVLVAK
jgi:hypothetical protein